MIELSGSLIKSGKFSEAIGPFFKELDEAQGWGVITHKEMIVLQQDFCMLLLKPDCEAAKVLGAKMLAVAIRIPYKVPTVSEEEFNENVKESRETQ